jgi:hypothetical protein
MTLLALMQFIKVSSPFNICKSISLEFTALVAHHSLFVSRCTGAKIDKNSLNTLAFRSRVVGKTTTCQPNKDGESFVLYSLLSAFAAYAQK